MNPTIFYSTTLSLALIALTFCFWSLLKVRRKPEASHVRLGLWLVFTTLPVFLSVVIKLGFETWDGHDAGIWLASVLLLLTGISLGVSVAIYVLGIEAAKRTNE
jgi:hypothetical protein